MENPSLSLNKPCPDLSAGDEHQGIHSCEQEALLQVFGISLSLSLCIYIHPFKKGTQDLRELESGRSGLRSQF